MVGYQLDDEPNLYMGNGCLTKHLFKETGCLEFQVHLQKAFSMAMLGPCWFTKKKRVFLSTLFCSATANILSTFDDVQVVKRKKG